MPLVLTVMWDETTLDDVEKMRSAYEAVHAEGRRTAFLVDSRRVRAPSPSVRRALADMTNGFAEAAHKNTIGTVVVLDSAILVGAMTAVRWFIRHDSPLDYTKTAVVALQSLASRASAEHVVFPPEVKAVAEALDRAKTEDLPAFGE